MRIYFHQLTVDQCKTLWGKPKQAWHMQAHDFNFTKSAMHVISEYRHINLKVEQAETKHTWCYTHCTPRTDGYSCTDRWKHCHESRINCLVNEHWCLPSSVDEETDMERLKYSHCPCYHAVAPMASHSPSHIALKMVMRGSDLVSSEPWSCEQHTTVPSVCMDKVNTHILNAQGDAWIYMYTHVHYTRIDTFFYPQVSGFKNSQFLTEADDIRMHKHNCRVH